MIFEIFRRVSEHDDFASATSPSFRRYTSNTDIRVLFEQGLEK